MIYFVSSILKSLRTIKLPHPDTLFRYLSKNIITLLFVLLISIPATNNLLAEEVNNGPEAFTMKEIVVTATRVEESVEDVAQDVTIVTAKEIAKASYDSIADVLKDVIGVKIKEYGNRGILATPSIRASTAEQVLILIDGRRLNLPSSGEFDLNDFLLPLKILKG